MINKFKNLLFLKNRIYKKHMGLILNYKLYKSNNHNNHKNKNIVVMKFVDERLISDFYDNAGRNIPSFQIKEWLECGHECWLAFLEEKVVGATWIFKGEFINNNFSGRCFTKNRKVKFENKVGCVRLTYVDPHYRGQGIGQQMLIRMISDIINKKKNLKRLVVTTGVDNTANIRCWMKIGGSLIGIVQVTKVLGIIMRRELFMDEKERCWF